MKTIFEYLLGNKNKKVDDPLEHVNFYIYADNEAKDIINPEDNNQIAEFKEQFLNLSKENLAKLEKVKFKIFVSKFTELRDKYKFSLQVNSDEFYETWTFNKVKNKFEKPESNCHPYYGKEWIRRTSAKKSIIDRLVETAIWKLK